MRLRALQIRRFVLAGFIAVVVSAAIHVHASAAPPTLWLIGDSTVRNGSKGLRGWGEEIGALLDPAKVTVQNHARGGRSSRTFLTEGLWYKVDAEIKPGDFVLMQFGHNDGGKVSGEFAPGRPSRASLKGNGEETQDAEVGTTGKKETVHTYGWYLRKFIKDAKARGATPIVLSPVPHNDWKDGSVRRSTNDYTQWASDAAKSENVPFIDLNDIVARHYEALGQDKVKEFFPQEHTHTSVEGARFNAMCVVVGIQSLDNVPLRNFVVSQEEKAPATATGTTPQ